MDKTVCHQAPQVHWIEITSIILGLPFLEPFTLGDFVPMFNQIVRLIAAQLKKKNAWNSQCAESISCVYQLPSIFLICFITQHLCTQPHLS